MLKYACLIFMCKFWEIRFTIVMFVSENKCYIEV